MPGDLNVTWIHGAANCTTSTDPPLQVHSYDPNTYILRESKCLNFEGNFLYLLLGTQQALLLDTGSQPQPHQTLPLYTTIQHLIHQWKQANDIPTLPLLVAHTHSHSDHTFGDAQFRAKPATTLVPLDMAGIQHFYSLPNWPEGETTVELGGRSLIVFPIPGHEAAHIALYDVNTQILLTGDTLYPGLLTVADWPAYRASVARLARFAVTHPISHVLGAHIEMKRAPRQLYPIGTTFQPDEHRLQLTASHIHQLHAACETMGDHPHEDVHDEFIISPL
jgi:hydroxyacylglutathione hydrolase